MSGQPSPLNSIDLSGNDLGEDEAQELCSALESNNTIVCLDLRANQVSVIALLHPLCQREHVPDELPFVCRLIRSQNT